MEGFLMKGLKRRVFGLCIALVTSISVFATAQPATTPKERREDRQEKREDRQEKREDKQEKREDRQEKREDKQEKREDRRDAIEDLRKTRQERRKEHLKEVRGRWGDIVGRPAVRAELKVHAQRIARLNRARRLADSATKTELVAKIDKLLERERARHQAAMTKMKTEGGKP
jgi:hypothetical protein